MVRLLATGQRNKGYDVHVVSLLESGVAQPSLLADLTEAEVPVTVVSERPRAFLSQRRAVTRVCRALSPTVLHSHGYLPDVLSASLGGLGAARVTTVHGFTGGGWKNRLYEFLQRQAYSRFDAVVAVSRPLASRLTTSSAAKKRTQTIRNAWIPARDSTTCESARSLLKLKKDSFNVGWVGRMSPEKAPDILIECLPLLADIPIHVSMIGDGRERERLMNRAIELGVAPSITWYGEMAKAAHLIPAFDLFVNSSRTEGTPITLFEAMDAGVPIVATAVGGVPDMLSPHEAIFVDRENVAALAGGIRDVYHNRPAASERAQKARRRLHNEFAVAPWIDAYEKIYREAIAAARSR